MASRQSFNLHLALHSLLCYLGAAALNQVQQLAQVSCPFVQHAAGSWVLAEADNTCGSVDFGGQRPGHYKLRHIPFGLFDALVEKLGQAGEGDSTIVFGDDHDVVLGDSRPEHFQPFGPSLTPEHI